MGTDQELTAGGKALADVLEKVSAGFGLSCEVRVVGGDDGEVAASVDGDGADALIGRGGAVIDALQYLGRRSSAAPKGAGAIACRSTPTVTAPVARRRWSPWPNRAASEALEFGEEIELDADDPARSADRAHGA